MKASAITLELLTPQIESFQAIHAIKDWNAMQLCSSEKPDMTDCHHESFISNSE